MWVTLVDAACSLIAARCAVRSACLVAAAVRNDQTWVLSGVSTVFCGFMAVLFLAAAWNAQAVPLEEVLEITGAAAVFIGALAWWSRPGRARKDEQQREDHDG